MANVYRQYLEKRALFPAWISSAPHAELALCVVIPAYHEPDLLDTLESLLACDAVDQAIEVIIVLNDRAGEQAEVIEFHRQQYEVLEQWMASANNEGLRFYAIHATDLSAKKAGVGLARKIGMDEAIRRFEQVDKKGIVVALDGDTLVAKNYFQAILNHFAAHPKCPAASLRYAHRLENMGAAQRRAIVQYELHLRIFLAAKRWTGFPFAYETIGSAMVVRCEKYCEQGGMNTRKAGEDFYFLNKFIALGHFAEINNTAVFPSARVSERVPFGTGRAMQQLLSSGAEWLTYPPSAFFALKEFFGRIAELREQPAFEINDAILKQYLEKENFATVLSEIKNNTASLPAFRKRFFRWFDAFRLMKYLHFALEQGEQKVSVLTAGKWIFEALYDDVEWPAKDDAALEEWLLVELRARSSV